MGFFIPVVVFTGLMAVPSNHQNEALTPDEERTVRKSVYDGEMLIVSPKMDFQDILVIPKPLTDLYKKRPRAVVDLLLTIMEGGNPRDSVLAAGYAIGLLDDPAVAVVCIDHFDKSKYDL